MDTQDQISSCVLFAQEKISVSYKYKSFPLSPKMQIL